MHILIVDDHPVVRQGIRHLLASELEGVTADEATNIAAALRLAAERRPDVAVVDLSLGHESGLDLIERLRAAGCDSPVLVLSVFDEALHAERAMRAGARGYVMKEAAPDLLVDAVRRAARGEIVLSAPMLSRLMSSLMRGTNRESRTGEAALSLREMQILQMTGEGLPTTEIATRLSRSIKTVEAHRTNIQRKLKLDSSLQLVRYATLWVDRAGRAGGIP
jgi:DNA-binding NarL/FixJ family response regulator